MFEVIFEIEKNGVKVMVVREENTRSHKIMRKIDGSGFWTVHVNSNPNRAIAHAKTLVGE